MKQFFNRLIPFILAGIAIVAFAFGIILFAYLFLFGALVGFGLFIIAWIRGKFFSAKPPTTTKRHSGRIIDSKDFRKMSS